MVALSYGGPYSYGGPSRVLVRYPWTRVALNIRLDFFKFFHSVKSATVRCSCIVYAYLK